MMEHDHYSSAFHTSLFNFSFGSGYKNVKNTNFPKHSFTHYFLISAKRVEKKDVQDQDFVTGISFL